MIQKIGILSLLLFTFISCSEHSQQKFDVPESNVEGQRYIAEASICPIMDYVCNDGETMFTDEVGCGCEENSEEEFSQEDDLPEATDIKYYVGDTNTCMMIRYTCDENWSYFSDDIGCGCEVK